MGEFLDFLGEKLKYFSPYILMGAIGAGIHRIRNKMNWKQFIGSIVISIFVSLSVGVICKDYFNIEKESVIFVICGISGVFSKSLLDEIDELIKEITSIIKSKYGSGGTEG